ncbi:DUF4291 domain-containing protein [Blastopirellula sp. J2-11]|uniref:DUF4291 domain-containing protein n=1 Tax=Blastopirellula sp. J2-11 TaxID=2943192 RepID=UPI0021C844FF|nr:DUF4291 domain-containing protein [Blastopirellula sp. J2-11]UUO07002.1 DUF4291 domain-containing protein [Blastopirellula sp. J2-11]
MTIPTERYRNQKEKWPSSGKHLLACFDDETILVYQAYSPSIGLFAARNGYFGGDFSYNRMSWIKPNFLWMMYRSNWGQSSGQEIILAIRLRRTFFDSILEKAVPSTFNPEQFSSQDEWKSAVSQSEVRLQWDPDHLPNGAKDERRAIQLGLRGSTLEDYGKEEIVEIMDMSEFVVAQRENAIGERIEELITPLERPYLPSKRISSRIGIESI